MAQAESDRWRGLCFGDDEVALYRLPSVAEARALRAEIDAAMLPVTTARLRDEVKMLLGSYPQAGPVDRGAYVFAVSAHLAGYPADIVADTCREVVRTCRFLPAVAELVEVAERHMLRRRRAQRRVGEIEAARARQAEMADGARSERRGAHAVRLAAELPLPRNDDALWLALSVRNHAAAMIRPALTGDEATDLATVLARLEVTADELVERAMAAHAGKAA